MSSETKTPSTIASLLADHKVQPTWSKEHPVYVYMSLMTAQHEYPTVGYVAIAQYKTLVKAFAELREAANLNPELCQEWKVRFGRCPIEQQVCYRFLPEGDANITDNEVYPDIVYTQYMAVHPERHVSLLPIGGCKYCVGNKLCPQCGSYLPYWATKTCWSCNHTT